MDRNGPTTTSNTIFEYCANFVRRVIPVQISGDLEKPRMNALPGIRTTIEQILQEWWVIANKHNDSENSIVDYQIQFDALLSLAVLGARSNLGAVGLFPRTRVRSDMCGLDA
jgi:hypothetical protein